MRASKPSLQEFTKETWGQFLLQRKRGQCWYELTWLILLIG